MTEALWRCRKCKKPFKSPALLTACNILAGRGTCWDCVPESVPLEPALDDLMSDPGQEREDRAEERFPDREER